MLKKSITMVVALVMFFVLLAGCVDSKPTEAARSGAYFASGNSGEYAVIIDNLITISESIPADSTGAANTISDVFEFSLEGNSYVGENVRKSLSFKLSGDKLTAKIGWVGMPTRDITFIKDSSIEFSDEAPVKLDASQDIKIYTTGMSWSFEELKGGMESVSNALYHNGVLAAGIEIKRSDTDRFVAMSISDFIPEPACFFDVIYPDMHLEQGTNIIRILHLGGPFLQDNKIRLSLNSDAIYFYVTMDAEGMITVEEIEQ